MTVSGDVVPDDVQLIIHSLDGRTVRIAGTSEDLHIGANEFLWDARDFSGNLLPDGIYSYQLIITTGNQQTRKTGKLALQR
jgi:hypothetical protein